MNQIVHRNPTTPIVDERRRASRLSSQGWLGCSLCSLNFHPPNSQWFLCFTISPCIAKLLQCIRQRRTVLIQDWNLPAIGFDDTIKCAMSSLLQKIKGISLNKEKFAIVFLAGLLLFLSQSSYASAQSEGNSIRSLIFGSEATLGVARAIEFKDKDVKDGSIVSTSEEGAVLSVIPYDSQVLGVVARDSAIVISSMEITDGIPIISSGQVYILVSSKDGPIEKGDLLTTSTIPGVAVKALKSGYVLGSALEDYDNSDPEKIEKIAADLNLHYFNSKPTFPGSLSDIFKIAILSVKEGPTPLLKYIIAALTVLGSFTLGFLTFGRTAAKGVEALGRNPAARGIIHLGIIFNVSIVIAIILSGIIVAFLILRL
jgi:F0F1-type ATP synthase membrane subunit c/vacuolar-type H+-ATPase subunit K